MSFLSNTVPSKLSLALSLSRTRVCVLVCARAARDNQIPALIGRLDTMPRVQQRALGDNQIPSPYRALGHHAEPAARPGATRRIGRGRVRESRV